MAASGREGATRIVLLHGTRFSGAQWSAYPALLPHAELVTPDLPGHGSRGGESFTLEAALAVVDEAVGASLDGSVGAAQPGERVVLAGHSLGGYVAAAWAARHPDALDGLVLIGAAGDPSSRLATAYRGFATIVQRVGAQRSDALVEPVWRRALGDAAYDRLAGPGASYAPLADAWTAVIGACGPHLLDDVICPVLILGGGLDQLHVHAGRYAARARDARVVTVPRATHLFPITQPERTAAILADFVDGLDGLDGLSSGGAG